LKSRNEKIAASAKQFSGVGVMLLALIFGSQNEGVLLIRKSMLKEGIQTKKI